MIIFFNMLKLMAQKFDKILITGTTKGIGSKLLERFVQESTKVFPEYCSQIYTGNRRPHSDESMNSNPNQINLTLDMSAVCSIDNFVSELETKLAGGTLDVVVLNAGIKATRKTVNWFGVETNQCRVVNLLANKYLIETLIRKNLLSKEYRILVTGSVTHWTADSVPTLETAPKKSEIASQEYANTKLGLFFLGKKIVESNPEARFVIVNPGLVDTEIFGKESGFNKIVGNFRRWLASSPESAADFINTLVYRRMEPGVHYFSHYKDTWLINKASHYISPKLYALHDVLLERFGEFNYGDPSIASPMVESDAIYRRYIKYMNQ